ncbi:hypothetical protein ASD79_06605 [Caulobacter sp. Root655]|uniref:Panacea domain-containing protein n=1 Tax=Caulobacter sp. Root655 TaxID=1736578 RepID=UPI0006FC89A0|nr:Panacea domain-containing protein [Caulobacter sp. Root655]KRA61774.1 hypothetical protein ASD79_06605 [Caulobacter sp. Root655]
MPQTAVQFDREKFKEAILYLAASCPPEELGNVKLHKMLYFADMMYFLQEGRPLTGVDYLKQKFGPTARHLTSAVEELTREGRLRVDEVDYHGFFKKDYIVTAPFERHRLAEDELLLLDDVADYVRGKTARQISEISHNAAWEAAELGEVIPYFTALQLVPIEVTDADRTWALEAANAHAGTRPF